VKVTESGPRRAGSNEVLRVGYRDPAPASGVATVTIRWGDRTTTRVRLGTHRIAHAYRRAGRYTVTVAVVDRAGNQTKVVRHVKIQSASASGKAGSGGK
jgi:hypothetical protein